MKNSFQMSQRWLLMVAIAALALAGYPATPSFAQRDPLNQPNSVSLLLTPDMRSGRGKRTRIELMSDEKRIMSMSTCSTARLSVLAGDGLRLATSTKPPAIPLHLMAAKQSVSAAIDVDRRHT